jgi:hypothetical protein
MSTPEEQYWADRERARRARAAHDRLSPEGRELFRYCAYCGSDAEDPDPVHAPDCKLRLRSERLAGS